MNIDDWSGQRVSCEAHGQTAIVRFHNADMGLMDATMERELLDVVRLLEGVPALRAVVLTGGQPDVFIRHYDVSALCSRAEIMRKKGLQFSTDRIVPKAPIHDAMELISKSRLLYIAALNGTAMGGGFELALACDLRVVQEGDHELGLPEINLGLLPGAGGTQRLARLLGESRAMEMLILGRVVRPAELVQLGLAQACVKDALAHATMLAEQIALRPERAARHIKALVRGARDWPLPEGEGFERTLFCDCMVDPEAQPLMHQVASHQRSIAAPPQTF